MLPNSNGRIGEVFRTVLPEDLDFFMNAVRQLGFDKRHIDYVAKDNLLFVRVKENDKKRIEKLSRLGFCVKG